MVINIKKKKIGGKFFAPPSKSVAHRALICACLREKKTKIKCSEISEDIKATIGCLRSLGYVITLDGEYIIVDKRRKEVKSPILDCKESGSSFRFMLPLVAALGCGATFVGEGRLGKRPMKELFDELENHGVTITHSKESVLPCVVSGKCENSNFSICGNVSSQYITGLVLSLPIMKKGEVEIVGKIESKPYIDITLSVMREFGFSVIDEYGKLVYNGYNDLDFEEYSVEGDFSNAAFFVVGGLIGAKDRLEIFGLSRETKQGDKAIIDIMTRFGGNIVEDEGIITIFTSQLQGAAVDVSDTPDLAPIIAVAGAAAKGETVIRGCARLREKESDRIESTVSLINGLGGNARVNGDSIIIQGNGKLRGGKVSSFGDHRIAMSAAIASLICEDEVIIDGAEAINKSFPRFFEIFDSLN